MQYRIRGNEVVKTTETNGTIQNISDAEAEISTSADFTDSFVLRGWDRITFTSPLYIRTREKNSSLIVLNVLQNFFLSKGGEGLSSEDKEAISQSFKAAKTEGTTVNFYMDSDTTGTPAFSFNFPEEIFLNQLGTEIVENFSWSALAYPNSVNPNLEGKTVFVLAVKGDKTTNPTIKYSFVSMEKLVDIYTASDTSITISGYKVAVNISAAANNAITKKNDGLHVDISGKVDKVRNATAGNIPVLDSDGGLTNSAIAAEDFYKVAVPEQDGTVTYNGTEQSPCWLNYDTAKMTVSGETSAIDAGSHTAIFALNSGHKWPDDSTAAKSVTWNIQKAASYIRTLTDSVAMVKGTATISLPVTTVGDGHFSASSDNADIVIVSSTKSEVVLSRIETGTATIMLSLSETDNYAACTLPITVTVSDVGDIYNIVFFKGDEDSWIDQCGNQFTPVQSEPTISSSTHIGDSSFCFYNWYDGLILDDVTLGGQDFTIDFWYNYDPPSINTTIGSNVSSQLPNVLNVYSTNSTNVTIFKVMFNRDRVANRNMYTMWAKYNIGNYNSAGTFAIGQWTHFAVVYSNSAARLYIYHNGALITNYGGAIPRLSGLRVDFGNGIGNPTYNNMIITPNLCMQYIRVSDGIARWTENFTPPTAEDY